jgi:DNA excision repair protein ERCC-4
MTSFTRTANDIKEYLSRLDVPADGGTDEARKGEQGQAMMESRFKSYLAWKADLAKKEQVDKGAQDGKIQSQHAIAQQPPQLSEAMKLKDKKIQERNASRRRVRGGAAAVGGPSRQSVPVTGPGGKLLAGDGMVEERMMSEAEDLASLWVFSTFKLRCAHHLPQLQFPVSFSTGIVEAQSHRSARECY